MAPVVTLSHEPRAVTVARLKLYLTLGNAVLRTTVIGVLSAAALSFPPAFAEEGMPSMASINASAAIDRPIWKTIALGTYRNANAMRAALDAVRVRVGESADEILGRPAFRFGSTRTDIDLVILSVAELGLGAPSATLADIHARAMALGFELCPAEVGPQLRRQYLDQPLGEFLHIAMAPNATYFGELTDFTVGNGGDGLLLICGVGHSDLLVAVSVRFVFVRPRPSGMQLVQE